MKYLITVILLFGLTGTCSNNKRCVLNNLNKTMEQSTIIDSEKFLSKINNNKAQNNPGLLPRNEFNIVSKNIATNTTDYINFDQEFYTYRQYAYDSSTRTRDLLDNNALGIDTEIKKLGGSDSDILYVGGYRPSQFQIQSKSNNRIIGDDDRELVADSTTMPYSACGFIIADYSILNNVTNTIETRSFAGTGFLEGPDLMATAGHVVFKDVTSSYYDSNDVLHQEFEDNIDNPTFPDEIRFYPAQNGSGFRPFGYVSIERVYIEKSYYLNQQNDWACCKLSTPIGYQTGWLGKVANFYQFNYQFESFGYPGSKNGYMYKSVANFLGYEQNTGNYQTNLDSEGGQSGSPYQITLDDDYVCGIHTYSVGDSYSGGFRINSFLFSFMNSFVTGNYSTKSITPTDYCFQDSYPTSQSYQDNYRTSYAGDFEFMTRRFRTGYIHNEYIVMSPIRTGITFAYIEYRFTVPVKRIDVQLSHWRSTTLELLTPSTGEVFLQVPWSAYLWDNEFDLLNDISMPIDRTHPETFTFVFDEPIFRFRFYSRIFNRVDIDANRGRICIGDMTVWSPNYSDYLPLSGYENLFDTFRWDDSVQSNSGSYNYILCNQVHPGTTYLWYQQEPGEYANVGCYPFTKQNIVSAVEADFTKYNQDFNVNKVFQEVSKDSVCPAGTYKVALASCTSGYHWYRQDADGYWTHKLGTAAVSKYDNSGNLIKDPAQANRGIYNNFLGYFAVSPWNNYY